MKNKTKGILWNTLGSAIFGGNSFVMLAMVSRVGTVEQAGYFGIAFTTAQILYIVGLFGVSHYQMTDYRAKYHFSDYACMRLFSCILAVAGCAGAIYLLQFTGEKAKYTAVLTALMLLNAVGDLYQSLFFQKNRLDLSGSALFYRTFWPLLAFCAVLIWTRSVMLSLVVQITANLAITLYYRFRVVPRFLADEKSGDTPGPRRLAWECAPLFASLLLMNVIVNASKYGVEFLMDDTAQGYYNMIFMPAQVINLCSQFLLKPFLSRYAELLNNKRYRDFWALLFRQIAWVIGLTGVCCLCAYWLGAPVLGFLYKKDLSAFALSLTLVVLGGGVFALCQLFYYVFVILRLQKYILLLYVFAMAVTVMVSPALMCASGLSGAAVSFAAVHGFLLICYVCGMIIFTRRSDRAGNIGGHNDV